MCHSTRTTRPHLVEPEHEDDPRRARSRGRCGRDQLRGAGLRARAALSVDRALAERCDRLQGRGRGRGGGSRQMEWPPPSELKHSSAAERACSSDGKQSPEPSGQYWLT